VADGPVAFVGEAVAFVGGDLGPVEVGAASGQVGLGGRPLALGLLDDLAGQLGQLARARRAVARSCWNAASGSLPWVAASTPLACSIQTRLVSACCSRASSSSRLASSTPVWTSSPATTASSRIASSSCGLHARGRVL
jgi:hypothetical protein